MRRPAAIAAIASVLTCVGRADAAGPETVRLAMRAPAATANAQAIGHVAASTNIPLAILFPARNQAGLDETLRQIYDPSSPRYHHFLTSDEFAAQFGPTQADYDTVRRYAVANGLTVTGTSPNRLILDVAGTAGAVEHAFNVHLNNYQVGGRVVRAADTAPAVPSFIAPIISGIAGLDTANVRTPHLSAPLLTPNGLTPNGGPAGGMSPSDFNGAYNITGLNLDGTGQTMAVFELDGYTAGDVTAYENYYNLPHMTLQNVLVDGYNGSASGSGGQIEVTMDIEIMIGVAPHATKMMVYEGPNTDQGVLDTYNKIATDNLAKSISSSWGITEIGEGSTSLHAENTIFQQMAAQGQSLYAASGDNGAYDNSPWLLANDPASQPYVCGVGGTVITQSNGSYGSEATWSGSGGGVSQTWTKPSWQTGVGYSSSMRDFPDVSLNSAVGYSTYIMGSWSQWAGTSAAAPMWGGFNALVNQRRAANGLGTIGLPMPTLYQIGASPNYHLDFHDIADNRTNGFYHAVTGFDDATGWGTINGMNLLPDMALNWALSAPSTPSGFTATSTGPTAINLTWSASGGATAYKIWRGIKSGGPYTLIGTPTGTSLSDSSLHAATSYYYTIAAVSGNFTSQVSSEISGMTTPTIPNALHAKPNGSNEVDLTWSPTVGATSYTVSRATSSGGSYTSLGSAYSANFQDTSASGGTLYYYVVAAVDAGGTSNNSAEVSTATSSVAPASLAASAVSSSQIDLTWSASTGATTYVVQRSVRQGGPYSRIGTTSGTAYSDAHLAASTTYYYVTSAANAGGTGQNSSEASATTAPGAPSGLHAKTNGAVELDLTWMPVKGADTYLIKRGTNQGGPYTQIGAANTTTYQDAGLSAATQYYYVVDAQSSGSTSADSAEASGTTAPNAPSTLTATAGSATVSLTWASVTGATSYVIYRSLTSGGSYVKTGSASSNSATSGGLLSNVTYYFVVAAVDSGGTGPYSPEASAVTLPATATGLHAKAMSSNEIDLTWAAARGATSYVVYRGTSQGGPYSLVSTSSSLAYQDGGLAASTQYYYVIDAVNPGGNSAHSAEVTATTPPGAPSSISASATSSTTVNVTWSAVTGASGYIVSRSSASGGPYMRVATSSSTSATVNGLLSGTAYYFIVAALNAGGTGSPSSEASASTPPPAPIGVHAKSAGSTEIDLTWSVPSGAASYSIYRSTSQGSGYIQIDSSYVPAYKDYSVSPGTTYYYVVKTMGRAGGVSTNSNEASAMTAPDAPAGLVATATGSSSISLTWSTSSGATTYAIWRSRVSGTGYLKIGTASTGSYTSTGLVSNSTYYYVVTATGTGGVSAYSSEASATTN